MYEFQTVGVSASPVSLIKWWYVTFYTLPSTLEHYLLRASGKNSLPLFVFCNYSILYD